MKNRTTAFVLLLCLLLSLAACGSAEKEPNWDRLIGHAHETVLEQAEKAGFAVTENVLQLPGVWDVNAGETLSGHTFHKELCFALNDDRMYGYRDAWYGLPNENTGTVIESLYTGLVKKYGEPTQKENEPGRVGPNLEEISTLTEGCTERIAYMDIWKDVDQQYEDIRFMVEFLPDGTVWIVTEYRDQNYEIQ